MMVTKELLESFYSEIKSKINYCKEFKANGTCNWDCCTYTNSYILLMPGEYESAQALGYDMSCYEIIDDNYNGGMKVVPKNRTCTICVNDKEKCGYEPLDCIFYPFWPIINKSQLEVIAGSICPIISQKKSMDEFVKFYLPIWEVLINDKDIYSFLEKSKMVGYETYSI